MPSGYKAAMGIFIIVILILLWIPFYEVFGAPGGFVDTLNSVTGDTNVQNYNETGRQIFYFVPLIIIIVIAIWVFKEDYPEVGNE